MRTIENLTSCTNVNIEEAGKTSPFATRTNEAIRRFVEQRPCGISIQPFDIEIVKLIGRYLILSSKMIGALLPEYDQDTVKKHIKKLTHSNYIYKAEFYNPGENGRSSAKFYALSTRGRGLLFNLGGEKVSMTQYVSELEAHDAKKLLSAIQYSVYQSLLPDRTDLDVLSAPIILLNPKAGERSTLMFRPQAAICRDDRIVEIVESVRESTDERALREKLDRMVATLSRKDLNLPVSDSVRTVLVCESYEHMLKVMSQTCLNRYRSLRLVYTYDLATFTSPEDCLYTYAPKKASGFFSSLVSACL